MSVMRGCDGEFSIGTSIVTYIDSFDLSLSTGTTEVSQLGNEFKDFIPTTKDWSGSASGTLDTGDTVQAGFFTSFMASGSASVTAKFKVASDMTLTGSVIVTSISVQATHGDKISISINFQGTGSLSKVA